MPEYTKVVKFMTPVGLVIEANVTDDCEMYIARQASIAGVIELNEGAGAEMKHGCTTLIINTANLAIIEVTPKAQQPSGKILVPTHPGLVPPRG